MLYILRKVASFFAESVALVAQFLLGLHIRQTAAPSLTPQTMKNILILGGSYAGITSAHKILKQTTQIGPFKVTLVSPNTHHFVNMASARGIVPDEFADEQLFQPIATGFARYPSSQFEHIIAYAKSLDVEAKTVEISGVTVHATLAYDILIIATGTRTEEPTPFKGLGSTETTKAALHNLQTQVARAKTIVIAGAGVTGVEVAGELKYRYKESKEIILLSNAPQILSRSPGFMVRNVTNALLSLQVSIQYSTRVISSSEISNEGRILSLSNGNHLATDLYIPTFGLTPNSSYIPSQFLNDKGFVEVDIHLMVKGAKNIWAVGDVSAREAKQYPASRAQAIYVASSVISVMCNKALVPYKSITRPVGIQVGKKFGYGHYGTWKMPNFMIKFSRKSLFTENLGALVDGSLSDWL